MAVDYLFVGMTFMLVIAVIFLILGLHDDSFPRKIFFWMFSTIFFFEVGLIFPAADETWGPAFIYGFWGLGLVNFSLLILSGVQMLDTSKKKRWEV